MLDGMGRNIVNFYDNMEDRILVEPNSNYDGGKIYCRKGSWLQRGDIIKVLGRWYLVNQLSNLASDVFDVGVITLCDATLNVKLGTFVYEVPAVVSKYSGNSNVRGVIDDSVAGKLSFMTGFHENFKKVKDNPCFLLYGKVWQIADYMNVNNIATVYCSGVETQPSMKQIGMSQIERTYHVGDRVEVKFYWLNSAEDLPIRYYVNNDDVAEVDSEGRIHFIRTGRVTIVATAEDGTLFDSPQITVR